MRPAAKYMGSSVASHSCTATTFFIRIFTICFFIFFAKNLQAQLTYNKLYIQYDSAWTYKNLQLIPVRLKTPSNGNSPAALKKPTISFKEAFESGKISIKEMQTPEGADVSVLQVKNHSKEDVLINSGEMLAGGKQDRASAATALIPSGEEFYLPVFCIEKGRWSSRKKKFTYAGSADANVKKEIDVAQRQNEVWKEIDRQYSVNKINTQTSPYLKLVKTVYKEDSSYWKYFISRMQQSDSLYAGFIAITGNRIINCELFSATEMTLLSYETLLRSYIRIVSKEPDVPVVRQTEVKNFTDLFLKTNEEQNKYLAQHGRADIYQGQLLHIVAYPE